MCAQQLMSVAITSPTAAYSSAHVYRRVTVAGAFPVRTHRTQQRGGKVDMMCIRQITLSLWDAIDTTELLFVRSFHVNLFCVWCKFCQYVIKILVFSLLFSAVLRTEQTFDVGFFKLPRLEKHNHLHKSFRCCKRKLTCTQLPHIKRNSSVCHPGI